MDHGGSLRHFGIANKKRKRLEMLFSLKMERDKYICPFARGKGRTESQIDLFTEILIFISFLTVLLSLDAYFTFLQFVLWN